MAIIRLESPFSRFPVLQILLHSSGSDFRLRTGDGRLISGYSLNESGVISGKPCENSLQSGLNFASKRSEGRRPESYAFCFQMETSGRINHRILPGRLAFRRSSESRLVESRERAFELLACDSYGNSGLVAAKLRANRIQSNRSVKGPKRKLIPCVQARIPVIN
jgi:hypothetical protein